MKTRLLLFACLFTMAAWGVESIPNGGFENWDSKTYEYPEFYPFNSNTNSLYDKTATFNVFKTTDKYEGSYAARLVTHASTDKNGFGYFINGNPEGGDSPSSWTGGIPINEKPTGIRGFYKYNVTAGDTAMVIVTFSKGGSNIGTYILPLFGIHTSYTEFNLTFTPALTQTPDSMILGFTSSWTMANISIPGSELFIDNVSLTGISAQPAKLNGNFESWSSNTIEFPNGWTSQNYIIDACKKTTDASTGSFALELKSYLSENKGISQARPAAVSNGTWSNNSNEWRGGIPYNSKNNILSFYYKYSPTQPKDSAEVWVMFKKNGHTVGYQNSFLTASLTYKKMDMPFYENGFGEIPDSVIIGIQSNQWSDTLASHVGSILKIDDLKFIEGGSNPGTTVPAFVPNGNFELWNSTSYEFPEFYPFNSNTNKLFDEESAFNVFKTTDKQSGSYAVRLVTNQSNSKNNFGYFLNGNPNGDDPNMWAGGIPCNEKPTGIKGWFKYNVASGDTALIIASFSKNGNNVGTYFLPLYGLHTSYTEFNLTFSPALTVTPDSMILGFASSWAMSQTGLAGSELFIDNVSLTGVISQPAKMNGDFESWGSNTLDTPQSWYFQNNDLNACKKTTDAADGNFALELTTYLGDNDGQPQARAGEIATGYYDQNRDDWAGGSPFTNTIDTLVFNYKYAPAQPKDSAQVSVQFKRNGVTFSYNNVFLTASSVYKYVEMPIQIFNPFFKPDSVIIFAQSSLGNHIALSNVGSVLKIDGLYFKSKDATTSIELVKKEVKAEISPNPTNGIFRINLGENEIMGVDIYNLSGQKVLSLGKKQIPANMEVDMTLYPRGIYLVRLYDGNKTYVEKLILK